MTNKTDIEQMAFIFTGRTMCAWGSGVTYIPE
jgi:hypothetical protein